MSVSSRLPTEEISSSKCPKELLFSIFILSYHPHGAAEKIQKFNILDAS